jgi:hypothetical protein
MEGRVGVREPGMLHDTFVARVVSTRRGLEDFSLVNDDRPVSDVAMELLARAGWI